MGVFRPLAAKATRWSPAKLDRLARSLPDPRAIADELTSAGSAQPGRIGVRPTDPVGRLLVNVLAMAPSSSPT
jgi:hypothetical protein